MTKRNITITALALASSLLCACDNRDNKAPGSAGSGGSTNGGGTGTSQGSGGGTGTGGSSTGGGTNNPR